MVTLQDVTERKRAEAALRESKQKMDTIFRATPVGIGVVRDRVIQEVNDAFCAITGYSRDELIGQNTRIVYPSDEDYEETGRKVSRDIAREGSCTLDTRVRRKDGKIIDGLHCSVALDPTDLSAGTLVTFLDISDRKRAQVSLERSEERYRTLVENSPSLMVRYDPGLRRIYVNKAWEKATGLSRDLVIGIPRENIPRHPHQVTNEVYIAKIRKALATGTVQKAGFAWINIRGENLYVDFVIVPEFDPNGNVISLLCVGRDITEQKRLEQELIQKKKLESVGRLAGGVAHDYNNILSVILGYTELAMGSVAPSDPLYDNLDKILKAAQKSAAITRQLLAFARKQTIAPRVLDVNQIVEGMLTMLRQLIGEEIDLAWLPAPGLWRTKIDPSQLEQILVNLCVNARDAISGVGKIAIETQNVTLDQDYCADNPGFVPGEFVMLAAGDDGSGMDEETLDHVFEPFFTTKEMGRGTGLGLSTVFGIVKQNSGFINVYSEPDKGTTVKIYLPRHVGHAETIPTGPVSEIPTGRGELVLFVEDDPAIRKMGLEMLEKLGYRVLSAGTPEEALLIAKERGSEIHLLITDVVMPNMNGRELSDQLHKLYPEIKILFMSGYTADVIAQRGVLDEGVQFIPKPFSMKDLGDKLRSVLD